MKVTFLGTGTGSAYENRLSQTILAEQDGRAYLFDVGAPVAHIFKKMKYDPNKLRAIFITHHHGDHLYGLNQLFDTIAWHYPDLKLTVFLPDMVLIDYYNMYFEKICSKRPEGISLELYSPGRIYDDGCIFVNAFKTLHCSEDDHNSYGFYISDGSAGLCITGDLAGGAGDFPPIEKMTPLNMVISECSHFAPEDAVKRAEKSPGVKLAFVHVTPPGKYDILKRLHREAGADIFLPEDMDVVDLK